MKIITTGNPPQIKENCKNCGCIFEYEKKDVQRAVVGFKDNGVNHMKTPIRSNVVFCPSCLEKIKVN